MSDKFSKIKSERLRQHFAAQEQEFTYSYALMKAGICARLLFIVDVPVAQRSNSEIQIPMLQRDGGELDRLIKIFRQH